MKKAVILTDLSYGIKMFVELITLLMSEGEFSHPRLLKLLLN